ncbi:MAG: hypothetical protein JWN35_761 [Frankiales bacterium]|jgi:hypothetical protein|nr:hypothetical protein [Frankiales bacterium]
MALRERATATDLIGRRVVDPTGELVGSCSAVFVDEKSGVPQWLAVVLADADRVVIVPLDGATEADDDVRLAVDRKGAVSAPTIGSTHRLSRTDQQLLSAHYQRPDRGGSSSNVRLRVGAPGPGGSTEPGGSGGPGQAPAPPPEGAIPGPRAETARSDLGAEAGAPAWVSDIRGIPRPPGLSARTLLARLLTLAALGGVALALRGWDGRRQLARREPFVRRSARPSRRAVKAARRTMDVPGPLAARARQVAARQAVRAGRRAQRSEAADRLAGQTAETQRQVAAAARSARTAAQEGAAKAASARRKTVRLLTLGMGLGAGYVMGAAAGRGRYEQMKQQAGKLAGHPGSATSGRSSSAPHPRRETPGPIVRDIPTR